MPKNKLINLTENTNIIPIKNLIIKGYSYKEILESINNVKKAKTAAAVTAGMVGTGIGTGIALKGISKNDPNKAGSIGGKQPESDLKKIGDVEDKSQLQDGELTKMFNSAE